MLQEQDALAHDAVLDDAGQRPPGIGMGPGVRGHKHRSCQSIEHVLEAHELNDLATVAADVLVIGRCRVDHVEHVPVLGCRHLLHAVAEELVAVVLGVVAELFVHQPDAPATPVGLEQGEHGQGGKLPAANSSAVIGRNRAVGEGQAGVMVRYLGEQGVPGVCNASHHLQLEAALERAGAMNRNQALGAIVSQDHVHVPVDLHQIQVIGTKRCLYLHEVRLLMFQREGNVDRTVIGRVAQEQAQAQNVFPLSTNAHSDLKRALVQGLQGNQLRMLECSQVTALVGVQNRQGTALLVRTRHRHHLTRATTAQQGGARLIRRGKNAGIHRQGYIAQGASVIIGHRSLGALDTHQNLLAAGTVFARKDHPQAPAYEGVGKGRPGSEVFQDHAAVLLFRSQVTTPQDKAIAHQAQTPWLERLRIELDTGKPAVGADLGRHALHPANRVAQARLGRMHAASGGDDV